MTMVVVQDLIDLAERCEKATGPDREIDCLIFELGHRLLTPERRGTIDGEPTGEYFGLNGDLLPERAPHFTGSMDDALSMMPEGWFWTLCQQPVSAKVWTEGNIAYWVPRGQTDIRPATPILALLVAILRARASMKGDG